MFKSPERIVEAKVAFEYARDGGKKLGAEFKREDGLTFGGTIDFVNPAASNFKTGAGVVALEFSPGSMSDSSLGLKKAFDLFKSERCTIDLVKGSLEVGAKIGPGGASVSAAFVLELLQGMTKFTYPFITLP